MVATLFPGRGVDAVFTRRLKYGGLADQKSKDQLLFAKSLVARDST
jgi:hypothetical protein